MDDEFEFEVWQDGVPVATATASTREAALREAMHYMAMYGQDGPVKLYEVTRREVVFAS
ncbi:MAG: hypothetical protein WC718_01335 [Phycisphaerales bacterium]|jgi:hypothetical protein